MAKKDSTNKEKKEKKHYFKDFKAELKKVIWPTPKQLGNNTVTVIVLVLLTALIVFVLDFVFESMNTYGINKLKEMVDGNESVVTNQVEDTTDVATEETDTNVTTEVANDQVEDTQADTNVVENATAE